MKITFDVDCTPQEARAFFGLPDLTAVHDVYLERMKTLMSEGVSLADFEKLVRNWMPGMVGESFDQWRQALRKATGGAG